MFTYNRYVLTNSNLTTVMFDQGKYGTKATIKTKLKITLRHLDISNNTTNSFKMVYVVELYKWFNAIRSLHKTICLKRFYISLLFKEWQRVTHWHKLSEWSRYSVQGPCYDRKSIVWHHKKGLMTCVVSMLSAHCREIYGALFVQSFTKRENGKEI